MKIKPLYIALFSSSLLFGCSSTEQQSSDDRVAVVSQTELALMIENARAEERSRIEKEFGVQWQQKRLYDDIRARKFQKQSLLDQRQAFRIKPETDQATFYQELNGQSYYRCAAPALNPIADSSGKWYYHESKQELSATLCETSRDAVLMKQLQQKLYQMGYLYGDGLTKQQLIDGEWNASTQTALQRYQEYHGLLYGKLTIEALEHLAIFPPSHDNYKLLGVNSIVPPTELEKQLQSGAVKAEPTVVQAENKLPAVAETTTVDTVADLAKQTKDELTKELAEQPAQQPKVLADNKASTAVNKVEFSSAVEQAAVISAEKQTTQQQKEQSKQESKQLSIQQVVASAATVNKVQKIIPSSRKPTHYQTVGGAKYYRCAANALVPQARGNGSWFSYSQTEKELAATLCKKSRDVATMTDLQYELYEKGFLSSDSLTKAELVDGFWGTSTLEAVKKYQQKHGLLYGQLTIETLEHIGVFESTLQQSIELPVLAEKSIETQQTTAQKTIAEPQVVTAQADKQQTEVASANVVTKTVVDSEIESKSDEVKTEVVNKDLTKTEVTETEVVKTDTAKPDFVIKQLQRLADDNFDLLTGQPVNSKAKLMGHINGYRVWRCGARALLPEADQAGSVQYNGTKEMRATLCKKSRTRPMMKPLQQALASKGYLKPMPGHDEVIIDGTWGDNTLEALKSFQKDQGIAYGQLTIESMVELGMLKIND